MKFFLLLIFIIGIVVIGCTQQAPVPASELDDFAKCLDSSGMKMYGQYTCGVCKQQRELFGSSFQYIGEIECHPRGENPQTQLCLEKDIAKTPTWILEQDDVEVKRLVGFQTLELLAEASGCSLQ
ncbi:hypothetical protein CMO93_02530 [Candidatus Woesearchaeota archaeon]|nr:hypothetical protein [Candidatus Woesearchaeota archaeon]|tara:strand:- start:1178 stop:1552 length:375 start_codon:yes stop_codon:yes gene_type:complete